MCVCVVALLPPPLKLLSVLNCFNSTWPETMDNYRHGIKRVLSTTAWFKVPEEPQVADSGEGGCVCVWLKNAEFINYSQVECKLSLLLFLHFSAFASFLERDL